MDENSLPVFNLDHDQIEALSNSPSNGGDIEQLRTYFIDRAVRAGENPPFPSKLVEQITESQLSTLQGIFNIPEADRYRYWMRVYSWVLSYYARDGLATDTEMMCQAITKGVPSEYLSEVFFLMATSQYRQENADRELVERQGGMWQRANQRAKDNADKLQASIQRLVKVLSLMDEDAQHGRMSRLSLPDVARWCKEHDFMSKLAELREVTEKDQRESQRLLNQMYPDVEEDVPRGNAEDIPGCVYAAVDRVGTIMAEIKGTKTRKIKEAIKLFGAWGIAISQPALGQARHKRKKCYQDDS